MLIFFVCILDTKSCRSTLNIMFSVLIGSFCPQFSLNVYMCVCLLFVFVCINTNSIRLFYRWNKQQMAALYGPRTDWKNLINVNVVEHNVEYTL